MPKEITESATSDGWADLMVHWGPDEVFRGPEGDPRNGEPLVQVFVRPQDYPGGTGGIYFHPDNPTSFNLEEGEAIGPVYANLDLDSVEHLIYSLKRAKKWIEKNETLPSA